MQSLIGVFHFLSEGLKANPKGFMGKLVDLNGIESLTARYEWVLSLDHGRAGVGIKVDLQQVPNIAIAVSRLTLSQPVADIISIAEGFLIATKTTPNPSLPWRVPLATTSLTLSTSPFCIDYDGFTIATPK